MTANRHNSIFYGVDLWTVLLYVLIVMAGWVSITSASYDEGTADVFSFSHFYMKQLMWIGVAWTTDFKTFHQVENAFLPFNRNGVLFPRKINGKFAMLSRPSDNGHTPFGDIYYSESPDLEFWGHHRHVMSPAPFEVSAWQCLKIGAGPIPIETSEGWLLFYHGVLRSCNGYVYAFGSALLDLDEPWKVKFRSGPYLISPREPYECMGDVPNVCFPCAALHDPATGRVAVYYGCADTVTGLAFGYIPEIIEFTKRTSII